MELSRCGTLHELGLCWIQPQSIRCHPSGYCFDAVQQCGFEQQPVIRMTETIDLSVVCITMMEQSEQFYYFPKLTMMSMNRIGPRTDPYSTPHDTWRGQVGDAYMTQTIAMQFRLFRMSRTSVGGVSHGRQCQMLPWNPTVTDVRITFSQYRRWHPKIPWAPPSQLSGPSGMQIENLVEGCSWQNGLWADDEQFAQAPWIEKASWKWDGSLLAQICQDQPSWEEVWWLYASIPCGWKSSNGEWCVE